MAVELKLAVSQYRCTPCSLKQGTDVKELVRMMPRAVVFNGDLVGEEWWGCPICLQPKFPVKQPRSRADGAGTKKRRGAAARAAGNSAGEGQGGPAQDAALG